MDLTLKGQIKTALTKLGSFAGPMVTECAAMAMAFQDYKPSGEVIEAEFFKFYGKDRDAYLARAKLFLDMLKGEKK